MKTDKRLSKNRKLFNRRRKKKRGTQTSRVPYLERRKIMGEKTLTPNFYTGDLSINTGIK